MTDAEVIQLAREMSPDLAESIEVCPTCDGLGSIEDEPCPDCEGSGWNEV